MALEKTITLKGEAVTFSARIFVAGCAIAAKNICQSHVLTGGCVNIVETEFVYTGGREKGVVVELINYPRFPKHADAIRLDAKNLAEKLIEGLGQGSATIVFSDQTVFFSRRPGE